MAVEAPYSGPWIAPKGGKVRYRGPAAIALKRTISRGWDDLIPWRPFNDQYNLQLAQAVNKIKHQQGWKVDGNVGRRFFNLLRNRKVPAGKSNAGDWAMDPRAVDLFEDAYEIKFPPAPPAIELVQDSLSEYLLAMEAYDEKWHYDQMRPYPNLGTPPKNGGRADCSGLCHLGYFWAKTETGVRVPDPSGFGYTGYGNTQSLWNRNKDKTVKGEYEIGDIALYGPSYDTKHATICRRPGSASTAIFTSNGSEPGPDPTRVFYRTDFLAVIRPGLLP